MLLWPVRWILAWLAEAVVGVVIGGVVVLALFRWVPLVPVPVIVELFAGEGPAWRWLRPSEAPEALLQAFRLRVENSYRKGLSGPAQAAAALLFPHPDNARGSEVLGTLLKLLWGEERLYHLYLSSAAWGPHLWGAKSAALHYFQKEPQDLTPEEMAELILLREYPQAARTPTRPSWFQKQRLAIARQIAHAAPQSSP